MLQMSSFMNRFSRYVYFVKSLITAEYRMLLDENLLTSYWRTKRNTEKSGP